MKPGFILGIDTQVSNGFSYIILPVKDYKDVSFVSFGLDSTTLGELGGPLDDYSAHSTSDEESINKE